jgi:hypothetical protein
MLVSTDGRFSTLTSRSIFSKAVVHRILLISYRREQREPCDQRATRPHWVTSSARSSSDCGS